ncbi:MAG: hypothetical protein IPF44_15965 [Betaproteobacteria bacterium]|nr:hypothetical protein [Betaproteobacteria bacterium]MBP6189136.1 hypothetical protein [Azonexus sp.]MBP6204267.1 hypothetical protein [Azonexus sp.]
MKADYDAVSAERRVWLQYHMPSSRLFTAEHILNVTPHHGHRWSGSKQISNRFFAAFTGFNQSFRISILAIFSG